MISRYFVSFNLATIFTFGLFFAMQMLISNNEIALKEDVFRTKIIFDDMPVIEVPPDKIEQPVEDVIEPEPSVTKIPLDNQTTFGLPKPKFKPERVLPPDTVKMVSFSNAEGDFVAIVRPAPHYPSAMAAKGLEGFVRLKYTITETGATEDVMVVNSSHRGFERNAVKAAQNFKFKPRVEDGQPQAVFNVYSTIEFKLEG